ncbi:WbqC family protein [Parasphingorhabdus sp.]|jgi:hypothetical protein|uniref:WbqC family protein n=1 Tax=Parasphingorhabdus sp. TaxID=2709688 RepID=UPI0032ED3EDA
MTTVVISQPMYFPWVGFMAQMALADVYIWLDDAAYSKGSFTNRVQVKTPKGRGWLTLPVKVNGVSTEIRGLKLAKTVQTSQRDTLKGMLKDAPCVADALSAFDAAWAEPGTLCDTIIASTMEQARAIGIDCPAPLRSSAMAMPSKGSKRVLDLVLVVGGTRYVTGHGAAGYLDHEAFEAAGIAVEYMDYDVPAWPQYHGDFTPYVSALDMIAHIAPDDRMSYIRPATLAWRRFLEQRT